MRYREGQDINNLQPESLTDGVSDITVAYTLIMAFIFIAMGRYGKQRWLIFWGIITIFMVICYYVIGWFDLL
ncbi:MAG: hypothetical protein KAT25_09175 [Sulfuriflexus sp.]|nr:hypothetical protein [Sulfuriflexus sp.]